MDRRLAAFLIASVAALLGLLLYMFAVAPYRVELTKHRTDMGLNLRVLQISDLHSRGLQSRESSVLRIVDETKPDLIVVTGDSVTDASCDAAAETLNRLHAPLGVYLVPGNWEHWMAAKQGPKCLCPGNVHCLRNRAEMLYAGLWIAGLDDAMTGAADLQRTLHDVPIDAKLLLLAHEPTAFDSLARTALVLAGHTHGGQVCLPGLGALFLPPGSGDYQSGWYHRDGSRMYVSRGIGTSVLPLRLWCTPEVALFEL